mmetsp:Transcript_15391/g.32563  ORF Transcript_15391/g.32563 Transcript_15391/m.32563 type:complete len:561 (+) Transcript_15391:412-2094(+)
MMASTMPPLMPPIPRHIIIKHEEDEVNKNASNNGSSRTVGAPVNTLPLVDEIDLQQCLISPSKPYNASAIQGIVIGKEQLEVICRSTAVGGNTNNSSGSGSNGAMMRDTVFPSCGHTSTTQLIMECGLGIGSSHNSGGGGAETIDGKNHSQSSNNNNSFQACPCCRRFIQLGSLGDIQSGDCQEALMRRIKTTTSNHEDMMDSESDEGKVMTAPETGEAEYTTLTSLVQAAVTTLKLQPSSLGITQAMAAPPLTAGDQLKDYTITETIVQGWLYKKGTGGDWAGRRWWKPRWVTLALANNPSSIVPTPILLSHRAPGVPYPVSIVELTDSTVIMAIDRTSNDTSASSSGSNSKEANERPGTPTKEEWNRHCFQIVHTKQQHQETKKNQGTSSKHTTRIFTAPLVERNEWVFAMNNALLSYEKRLSKARSDAAKHEYWTVANHHHFQVKKARMSGARVMPSLLDEEKTSCLGSNGCGSSNGVGNVRLQQREQPQQQKQQPHLPPRQPWTSNVGRSRMRSPSPVRVRGSMGLPPTSPRRVRSPSPSRSEIRPLYGASISVTP